jgi:hypothetical protein
MPGSDIIPSKMSIRNQIAVKTEEARQKMMVEAGPKLAYMKMMKEHAQNTTSGSDEMKQETIMFFETKIRELENDVTGSPRYTYNLRYPVDFGREANGVDPEFANSNFTSTAEIVEFVNQLVMTNDMLFISDTYMIPSASDIDTMLDGDTRITRTQFDINADEDEDSPVPLFEVSRIRTNY